MSMKRFAVLAALLLVPSLVYAHVYLRSTDPADGAVLDKAPQKVSVTFVGSVETAFSKVEVFAPDGEKVSDKTRFFDSDSIMEVGLKEGLPAGEYTVRWHCVSLDGHSQKGLFKFKVQ
jgi:methionine-rich copper-binding protein CopC